MTKNEATKLASKLVALFPNTPINEMTLALWVEYFMPLNADVINKSINEFALSPNIKKFPLPGEIIDIYDRIYQDIMTKKAQADREAVNNATKLLFHEPLEKIDRSMGRIAKLSVALVRDVCEDKIKYKSPEWNKRQLEIEKLAGVVSYVD